MEIIHAASSQANSVRRSYPRQQEGYNFQKVSAVLADFGYVTIRLTNDWCGADFIAQHSDGISFLKVQLKGRLTFSKKYCGQGLFICFRDGQRWYLYPHDEVLEKVLSEGLLAGTDSWEKTGCYHFPYLKPSLKTMLGPYGLDTRTQENSPLPPNI